MSVKASELALLPKLTGVSAVEREDGPMSGLARTACVTGNMTLRSGMSIKKAG